MAIWDAFFFNDELDLLEFRLRELEDHATRFVLVEATRTYSGRPKPLHYQQNRHRFGRWEHQIHHVVAELDEQAEEPWLREHQQRRRLDAALRELVDTDDLVLIGDIDEIPRRELLPWLTSELVKPVRLEQQHAMWHANTFLPDPWDDGTLVARPDHLDTHPRVRFQLGFIEQEVDRSSFRELVVRSGGWHLSSLGGVDAVRSKMAAYSHQEYNRDEVIGGEHLDRLMRYGVRLDGRHVLTRVDVSQLDPALQRLASLFPSLIDPGPDAPRLARSAYAAFTWLRASAGLPLPVAEWLDRHHWVVTLGPLTPLLLMLQGALVARRRIRPDSTRWKITEPFDPRPGIVDTPNDTEPPVAARW
jgi:hypothetical protein